MTGITSLTYIWTIGLIKNSGWEFGLVHPYKEPVGTPLSRLIVGVDPGMRDLIRATSESTGDFRAREGKQARKATSYSISNKEYQHRRGLYRSYQLELGRRQYQGMQEVYDQLVGSPKTGNINNLRENLNSQYNIRTEVVNFNNGFNYRETQFFLFSQRQIALTRIRQELQCLGSLYTANAPGNHNHNMMVKRTDYPVRGTTSKRELRNRWLQLKERLVPINDALPILSYGDKSLSPTMRRHAAMPVKYIREFFSETLLVIMVDEFRTSIRCSHCEHLHHR